MSGQPFVNTEICIAVTAEPRSSAAFAGSPTHFPVAARAPAGPGSEGTRKVRGIRIAELSRYFCNGQAASRQCSDGLSSAAFAEHVAKGQLLICEAALEGTDVHGQSFCDEGNRRDPAAVRHERIDLAAHQQTHVG
jgi:hypothetical protein